MPDADENTAQVKKRRLPGGKMKALLGVFVGFIAATAAMYVLALRLQNGIPPALSNLPVVGDMLRRAFPQAAALAPRIWQRDDLEEFIKYAVRMEIERLKAAREALAGLQSAIGAEGQRLQLARKAFAQVRASVENLLAVPGTEREANLKRLAALYASMRPEEAAKIVSALDDDAMVLDILKRMDERAAGKLLAAMDPKEAARLSAKLGGTVVPALAER